MATNTDVKYHHEQLHRHCRVCAQVIVVSEYKYSCKDNIMLLQKCSIHVGNDKSHILPHLFCGACHGKQVEWSLQRMLASHGLKSHGYVSSRRQNSRERVIYKNETSARCRQHALYSLQCSLILQQNSRECTIIPLIQKQGVLV